MMFKYSIAVIALLLSNYSGAQDLPEHIQRHAIVNLMESSVISSTSVAIAKADIARAEAKATTLRVGSYEFEAAISGGRREISELAGTQEYNEWSGGLSRTLRLPGKRKTDHNLADIEVQLASAAYEDTLSDERLSFIEQYSAWSTAYRLVAVAKREAEEAQQLAELVQIQVERGAGRQIDADQLLAESELAMLQAEQAEFTMITTKRALETYYPNIVLPLTPAEFVLSATDIDRLSTAKLSKSPKQYLAEITKEKARLTAQRARQDRMPDPTVGVAFTDEFDGQESAITAHISIPLGGSARRASSRLAIEQMNMSSMELDLANRVALQQISMAEKMARLSLSAKGRSDEASTISMAALNRLEQGYKKEAVTISDLIRARRSHYLVERVRIEQQGKSEQAFLTLLAMYLSVV
jgi:outer membrane protein TolC